MLGSMNILLIDTCFGACSVAAAWRAPEGMAWASRFELLVRGHAERLTPMIGEVMEETPFGFSEIACIGVTTGPGTFTGQRVGIAAARALALATGAKVATLSSLHVMAFTAAAEIPAEIAGKTLAVAVDARRGEVYFQRFAGPSWGALDEPVLITPEDAVRMLGAGEAIVVGSGGEAMQGEAVKLRSAVTARLGALQPNVRFVPDGVVTPGASLPRPLYLRPPDAKPQDGAALARAS